MSRTTALAVGLMLAWPGAMLAASEAPAVGKVWIREGACPLGGCSRGKWPVQEATAVRREPDRKAPKDRCERNPDPRYCWAEVLLEPVCRWWAQVEARHGQVKGWVLVDEGGVQPKDVLE
jgi:hypothetical protein